MTSDIMQLFKLLSDVLNDYNNLHSALDLP